MSANGNDDELRALWQDTAPVDVQALTRTIARGRARMRFYLVLEVALTAALVGFLGWLWLRGAFSTPLMLGITFITVALQWWSWSWRRGLWHAVSGSPPDMLRLQRQRAQMSIKIARSFSWGAPISLMFGVLVRWLMDKQGGEPFSLGLPISARLTLLLAMGIALSIGAVWGLRREKQCKAEIAQLDAQIAALKEDDDENRE